MPLVQPSLPIPPLEILALASDSESATSLSFGEVLKVEEKKLQEQMTNAPVLAAMLATLQPQTLIPPVQNVEKIAVEEPKVEESKVLASREQVKVGQETAGLKPPSQNAETISTGSMQSLRVDVGQTKIAQPVEMATNQETQINAPRERVKTSQTTRMDIPAEKISRSVETVTTKETQVPAPREQVKTDQVAKMNVPAEKITQLVEQVAAKEPQMSATHEQVTTNKVAQNDVPIEKIAKPVETVVIKEMQVVATSENIRASFPANETYQTVNNSADTPESDLSDLNELSRGLRSVPVATPMATTQSVAAPDAEAEARIRSESAIRLPVEKDAMVVGQENARAEKKVGEGESVAGGGIRQKEKEKVEVESEPVFAAASKVVDVKPAAARTVTPVDVNAFEVVQQVVSQFKARVKNGETSIKVQLNPKELGAIEVEVTRGTQGVSVSFVAEKSGTSQLLEAQAGQLRQSLKEAGVQLMNLNVGQQHQNEGGGFGRQSFARSEAREAGGEAAPQVERAAPQKIASLSEIDYLV